MSSAGKGGKIVPVVSVQRHQIPVQLSSTQVYCPSTHLQTGQLCFSEVMSAPCIYSSIQVCINGDHPAGDPEQEIYSRNTSFTSFQHTLKITSVTYCNGRLNHQWTTFHHLKKQGCGLLYVTKSFQQAKAEDSSKFPVSLWRNQWFFSHSCPFSLLLLGSVLKVHTAFNLENAD